MLDSLICRDQFLVEACLSCGKVVGLLQTIRISFLGVLGEDLFRQLGIVIPSADTLAESPKNSHPQFGSRLDIALSDDYADVLIWPMIGVGQPCKTHCICPEALRRGQRRCPYLTRLKGGP